MARATYLADRELLTRALTQRQRHGAVAGSLPPRPDDADDPGRAAREDDQPQLQDVVHDPSIPPSPGNDNAPAPLRGRRERLVLDAVRLERVGTPGLLHPVG